MAWLLLLHEYRNSVPDISGTISATLWQVDIIYAEWYLEVGTAQRGSHALAAARAGVVHTVVCLAAKQV